MNAIWVDWNFWALLVAAITLVHTLWPRRGARLDYLMVSNAPLITVREESVDGLTILYEGRKIDSLHMVEFALINTGDKPIRQNDFENSITIVAAEGASLVDVSSRATTQNAVRATYNYSARTIRIDPLLINPGDSVSLRVLVDGLSTPWNIGLRIAGVSELKEILNHPEVYDSYKRGVRPLAVGGAVVLIAWVLGVLTGLITSADFVVLRHLGMGCLLIGVVALAALHPRSRILAPLHRSGEKPRRTEFFTTTREVLSPDDRLAVKMKSLVINAAIYGKGADSTVVTEILRRLIVDGRLDVNVSNESMGGDPIKNVPKELWVHYAIDGVKNVKTVPEGSRLTLP